MDGLKSELKSLSEEVERLRPGEGPSKEEELSEVSGGGMSGFEGGSKLSLLLTSSLCLNGCCTRLGVGCRFVARYSLSKCSR